MMTDLIDLFTNASAADHGHALVFATGWVISAALSAFLYRHAARQQGDR